MTQVSTRTMKRLFAVSGNRCAFPNCQASIADEKGTIIGRVCHIEADSPGGPRYNSVQSDDERQGFENLILICANHHTVIDDDSESYTVASLKKIKADHEQKYANGEEPTNEVVDKLLQTITNKDRIIYIKMISSEIELCISTLELDSVQSLPVDRWTSAVNSGALRLFDVNIELVPLSRVYQKIKDYNHLLTSEHFNVYSWERLESENGCRLPIMIVKRFLRDKESLLDDLRALNDAEWLNPQ
jgi:hypothetical protein